MERADTDVVPRVALGCAVFGGVGSLPDLADFGESREAAFALMDAAWHGGIRMFDTADAYAGGTSERWIGEWMQATGCRPHITTKTYNPMGPRADAGLSRERLLRQVHGSLGRLGIDRIDLYLAHEFDSETDVAETWTTFQELADSGVIGTFGVSNFSASQLRSVLSIGTPAVIQNSYSLLNRRDDEDVMPLAHRHGVAYQAYSPLAGGWLSGKYGRGRSIEEGSRLAVAPQWYEHVDASRAFDALDEMKHVAVREQTDMSTVAHGWVLAQPLVAGMVVGPRRLEHFRSIFEARDHPLDPAIVAELSEIFRS